MSGKLLSASECGKRIVLLSENIEPRLREFLVLTTNKEICFMIDKCNKRDISINKMVYKEVLLNVLKYSNEELTEHWNSKSQEWIDWCNDVALFYCVKLILFNKPIPIYENMCGGCGLVESNVKLRKCSICENAYYCSTECQSKEWSFHKQICSPCP